MALIREAGYAAPIHIHGALERLTIFIGRTGSRSATCAGSRPPCAARRRSDRAGARPRPIQKVWSRRFPDPVTCLRLRLDARARPRPPEGAWSCRS